MLRTAVRDGSASAVEALRQTVIDRRPQRSGHLEWGRLCEEAGESGLALSEYQLALRDDPEDVAALGRLAVLYEERGELRQAAACAERWVQFRPGEPDALATLVELLLATGDLGRAREALRKATASGVPAETCEGLAARIAASAGIDETEDPALEAEPLQGLTDGDVVRFLHLFSGRENVYARQWAGPGGEGGYSPVREPLTVHVARNHLLGNVTVGVYPLRLDDTVAFFAFDFDITKRALARARGSVAEARRLKELVSREARRLHEALAAISVPALLEDSGYKGRHLWIFLEAPVPASVVRNFGDLFLRAHGPTAPELSVEFFPRQAKAQGGVGNLIKLPLGIHRRSGRRSRLLRSDGSVEGNPHDFLRSHPRLSRQKLEAAIVSLKASVAIQGSAPRMLPASQAEADQEPATPADLEAFPVAPPTWTGADFHTHPEVATILRHCPVLDALRTKVEQHRRLTHEEQVVLQHSLGHSGAGVLAVNYLLDACVDVRPSARLQSPLAGNPISCPKIRKRIPHVTGSVRCNCLFDFAPGRYPTPRLHLLRPGAVRPSSSRPAEAEPRWTPPDRVRTLRALRVRQLEIAEELARVEAELVAYIERSAVPEVMLEEGVLRLIQGEGQAAALVWEPRSGPALAGPAATEG
jgi:hypothetical protein